MLTNLITAMFQEAMLTHTRWFAYWLYGSEIVVGILLMALTIFGGALWVSLIVLVYVIMCFFNLQRHRKKVQERKDSK